MSKIPFIKPHFPAAEELSADYRKIVESNWFTNFGSYEQKFSQEIADFIGQNVSVATVANATLGIDIAVRALFSKTATKDQVLVPSFTFAAGPEVLISHGFTPVFIDVSLDTWQPDAKMARKYLDQNIGTVAGILLCNIFGVGNEDIDEWEKLAKEYSLPLIIDTAAGLGSQYDIHSYVGARGDCEIFSLHATKPFGVGEGGLVVSRSSELIEKIKSLENFGFGADRKITHIGTNAKLQELNCAIGLRQLTTFKERVRDRQKSLHYYKEKLSPKGYSFQSNDELSTVPFVSTIAKSTKDAESAYIKLQQAGVEVKRYYAPLHLETALTYYSISAGELINTETIASRILSLPLHDHMDMRLIDYIVETI